MCVIIMMEHCSTNTAVSEADPATLADVTPAVGGV